MIWRLVARISSPGLRTVSLTGGRSFDRASTTSIALGPRRMLKCACGRTWVCLPDQVELPPDADVCTHIMALYWNGEIPTPVSLPGRRGSAWSEHRRSAISKVHLTPLGHELFDWRYAARALKDQ